jgi:hypothetical protein
MMLRLVYKISHHASAAAPRCSFCHGAFYVYAALPNCPTAQLPLQYAVAARTRLRKPATRLNAPRRGAHARL